MLNILMVNFPAEGHVNPSLGIVKALVERGDKVHYITTKKFEERIKSLGAHVHLHTDYFETLNKEQDFNLLFEIFVQTTLEVLEITKELSESVTFDAVYYDTFGSGKLVREYLRIPGISSSASFLFPDHFFENIPLYPDEEGKLLFDKIKERFGVSPKNYLQFMRNDGELNIVYTSRYFQPNDELYLEGKYTFIGPNMIERNQKHDFPIEELKNHKVLFISLGTVLQNMEKFFNTCIEAFADFDGKVVISTGQTANFDKINPAPDHFIIRPYVPQLEVLKYTDIFITHGGMNSVNEAIYYETLLVVVPFDKDQPAVAKRLEELEAGCTLSLDNVHIDILKDTVSTVLTKNTYQKGIKKIKESFENSGGVNKALQVIDQFIKNSNKG